MPTSLGWYRVSLVAVVSLAFVLCGRPDLAQGQQGAVTNKTLLPQANIIHVEIGGLHNDKGQVFCALYSSPDGVPKNSEKAVARIKSSISDKQAVCEFSGMSPGIYAVSVFHDEDSNGKLDTNFMGIPREGVGASNDAKAHLGPPKFDAAAFHFSGERLDLNIRINYL